MDMGFEQKIRERAYEIWMANGMSDGMALDHWRAAEHDLTAIDVEPMHARVATKLAARTTKTTVKTTATQKTAATRKTTAAKTAKANVAAVTLAPKRMSRAAKTPGLAASAMN